MSWLLATGQASPPFRPHPLLSHGCLSTPQSSILDLADVFAPAPALPSTHCSADPWDIPGGHAGFPDWPLRTLLPPSHLLANCLLSIT